jgi:hypothetical protein
MKYILESGDTGAAINPKYNLGHEGALNRVIVFRNSTVREALRIFKNRDYGYPCLIVSDDEYNFYGIMTEKDINAFLDNNPNADLDSVTVETAYNRTPKYVITVSELDCHNKNNTDPFENLPPSVSFMPLLGDGKIINFVFNKRFYKPEPSLEEIIESIKAEGRLDGINRVGIFFPYQDLGDIYYAISAMECLAKKIKKKIVVINWNKALDEVFSYFFNNSLNFEVLSIKISEFKKIEMGEEYILLKYNDTIKFLQLECNREIKNIVSLCEPFAPLIYPKFPDFDTDFYINKYNIIPGETIFIVPIAKAAKSFPVYFWNFCAEVFKFMGYNVLFNVPDNIADQYNGKNCFVPLKDAVGLADLCGHVFAIRTGFLDFISTTKANITIFDYTGVWPPIDKLYHIDNSDNRIKIIYANSPYSFDYEAFSPIKFIKKYTDEILSGFKYQLKARENFMDINKEIKIPNIEAYKFRAPFNEARRITHFDEAKRIFVPYNFTTSSICPCKYSFVLDKDTLYLQFYELDLQKFRLNLVLKRNMEVVHTLTDYNILSVIFKPELGGEYRFEVSIYDKKDLHLEFFITDSIVIGGAL